MSDRNLKTILLVEDEMIIAMAEIKHLEKEGYRVLHASSGPEAIETVNGRKNTIDLILMDMDLGEGMTGTDAAVEILKTNDIAVVFLSSHTEKEVVHKIDQITSYGYVIKDASFTVLAASVKMALKLFDAYQQMQKTNEELLQSENSLKQSEASVRNKLKAILEPEGDIGSLDLSDIIDAEAIQSMIDRFYELTKIGIAISDMKGNILVQNAEQDICSKFHKAKAETRKECEASINELTVGLVKGRFTPIKCRNCLWDSAIPILIGERHMGNLFLGQFFYEDDVPDREKFRERAGQYGFDEAEYLSAFEKVPRCSRAAVESAMQFYAKLSEMISTLSYSTIRLSRTLSESQRTQAEREKLQGQLVQAQKMESVGRLAGGVAHDYNNMLSVIIGYTELAMETIDPAAPVQEDLMEILKAAKRSADITRQLLAFARKQTIAPEVLDLNETIEGMLKMLRWLIGEDIKLGWQPGSGLSPVNVDPSQIDQILANLCVNARDAIAGVGNITIVTDMVTLDEDWCAAHEGFISGLFVMLSVSDTGCGMEREILDKIFEPFFTTKELGHGTGLGLATIYGIVKQNSGFISVNSEIGKGSVFNIYLPPHRGKAGETKEASETETPHSRGETVLLVEDELALLNMGRLMLEKIGYRVLAADRPGNALRLAETYPGKIDILITDVVMPEMNGRDLAERLRPTRPEMKRLFMSGYTAKAIANRGVLEAEGVFIQKPFSQKDLAVKVREALDSTNREQQSDEQTNE